LKSAITLRAWLSSVASMRAISGTECWLADASGIAARWRVEKCLAFLESCLSRWPSAGLRDRTNTDGGRMTTSKVGFPSQFDVSAEFPVKRWATAH